MNTTAKAWLPDDATDPARIAGLLDEVLQEWSDHWLKSERATSAPAFQDDWPGAGGAAKSRAIPDVASVVLTPNAQSTIASAMLGCAIPPGSIQPKDRAILERISAAAIDDLLGRIASRSLGRDGQSKAVDEPIELDRPAAWEVSFRSGKRAFKLAISTEAQVAMVKRRLPPPSPARLAALDRGLAEQRIELAVDLGRCALSLGDLRGLGSGDVIVLDRSPEDVAGLLIDGSASPLRGTLESSDGRTQIVLDQFGDQHHG